MNRKKPPIAWGMITGSMATMASGMTVGGVDAPTTVLVVGGVGVIMAQIAVSLGFITPSDGGDGDGPSALAA